MKICILTSGHDVYDNRIYYKEILSLRKVYSDIYIVAPGEKDFITEQGIKVKCFPKRKAWYDRIEPMRRMFEIGKKINADIYHAHEPDSFQIALKLKRCLNSKAIYDSHEYHPEGFSEHFKIIKTPVKKILYKYEKKMCKNADYIISVNDILINKFKQYNNNVALIPNYPVMNLAENEKCLSEKPVFVYVGGLREDRGILKILEAINLIDKPYKYIFIGPFESKEFEDKCMSFIKDNTLEKDVIFTGKIPHIKVFEYLKTAWAGFVLLQPINWRYINSEPIKLFEYMMGKTPVIASDFPMMRNIIEEGKSGIVVDPTSKENIADVIRQIGDNRSEVVDMGENGYELVNSKYNWNVCEKRILDLYSSLHK